MDWQERLRRLGVVKGARALQPPPSVAPSAEPLRETSAERTSLERLLPGSRVVENNLGGYLLVETVWPAAQPHGRARPSDLLAHSPAALAGHTACALPASFEDVLFLDTETTGLAGANTVAFMVGTGNLEGNAFVVRQFFLRSFEDEPAMLHDLGQLLARSGALATFNGRAFDAPLLLARYALNRQTSDLARLPHLDLLWPARRLWRRRLGSVALGALEAGLLAIGRGQHDVPGYLIPTLYHDYLRSGDPRPLLGVFYHNRIDVLSMLSLLTHLVQLLERADVQEQAPAADLLSLGLWQMELELPTAEATLRRATDRAGDDLGVWQAGLLALAQWLKRSGRRAEALPLWLQVAHTTAEDVSAHIELAKQSEWRDADLPTALLWTRRALALTPPHAVLLRRELQHRCDRLQRKLEQRAADQTADR